MLVYIGKSTKQMKEELLHFAWMYRIAGRHFRSTKGEPVDVEHPGVLNHHAGPDFLNARVRIGDTRWAGNIEVHFRASDWDQHGHSNDLKYSNVVLHVVMEFDTDVHTKSGRKIPCVELSAYLPDDLSQRFDHLLESEGDIPCHSFLGEINWPPLLPWLGRLALERLEKKARELISRQEQVDEPNSMVYQKLFTVFGIPANQENFSILAGRFMKIPDFRTLDADATESALLWLGGLLEGIRGDKWVDRKQADGQRICGDIPCMDKEAWSFLRMRPASFPTVRLALLSSLLPMLPQDPWNALGNYSLEEWSFLSDIQASAYWDDHFIPGRESTRSYPKGLGKQFLSTLIANWLAPLLTAHGLLSDKHTSIRKAFTALERTEPEENRVTRLWQDLKLEKITATESQGLLELHNSYCRQKRCLECRIGYLILNNS